MLTLGALYFSKDANLLILEPVEAMIEKVNKIARNPMSARGEKLRDVKDAEGQENEAYVVENAIIKIGVLLALGFGDAGSEIIA